MNDSEANSDIASADTSNPCGSLWHRWEPHIHVPGTLHNDQFGIENPVDEFIKRVNEASPCIRAIGITDYYVFDSYKQALEWKNEGRLPNVDILFPNIELRFAVNAGKGSPINFHLLISPEDENHIEKAERFLNGLTFKYSGETYHCTRTDIIQFGYAYKPEVENEQDALKAGAGQFKIEPDQLLSAYADNKWARQNILTAIAASKGDGTAQLQADGGLSALRKKLECQANIIFSANSADRKFWLGQTDKITRDKLDTEYGGPKPCLHGSDAHDQEKVGNPDLNRFCWLKGDLAFETLRQACIEPEGRAYVGEEPPRGSLPSNTITHVSVSDSDWLEVPEIPINSGLVAIIGARGSGKTALVELIAAGAYSINSNHSDRSFLNRANELIGQETCTLSWGGGEPTSSPLDITQLPEMLDTPRVRYLSQQFVDRLCSSVGLADELITEIERIVFQAHPPDTRYGASSFSELRSTLTTSSRRAKERYKEALAQIENELSVQHDLMRSVVQMEKSHADLLASIERDKQDRTQLTPSENKTVLDHLEAVRNAAEKASQDVAELNKRQLELSGLLLEANQFRGVDASNQLAQLKSKYQNSGLSNEDWERFKLTYDGDIDTLLEEKIKETLTNIDLKRGPSKGEVSEFGADEKAQAYFSDSADISAQTLSLLQKEQRRLEALVGIDAARRKKYSDLNSKIAKSEAELLKLGKQVHDAKDAQNKIDYFHQQRQETYESIFNEIVNEEGKLRELYKPLEDNLRTQKGSLNKLTFSVKRHVELKAWTDAGESSLDVRKVGAFRGKGALYEIAEQSLLSAWQSGNPTEITEAMSKFKSDYGEDLWNHIPDHAALSRDTKKAWFDKVSAWLFSTDHIEVKYNLQYEGVDIQQLSPGTRGIVLLLLYLSIDKEDDRPLIIDQPEENLDPQSIYSELVERFKEAKTRRQIIIVTHNANLVVNTDADQVIVATCGVHRKGQLPLLTYQSGGLENPDIRKMVCDILEGGKAAFMARARRLRVALPAI